MSANRSINPAFYNKQTFVELSVHGRDVMNKPKAVGRYFDHDKFDKLTGGYDKIQAELIEAFLEFTPALLEELRTIAMAENVADVARILHKLKSSTSLLCSDSLYSEIIHLEENANHVSDPDYKSRIAALITSHEVLMEEAETILKKLT
ncbi:Hpt domain-containing protein [Ohtaekwangia kribbensis]|jgi:HPt (histidine-containing phosphotransfer) domain-containing protein|uniref:Hpt domain-containing protein n=1 Tax=Ohtaekwangia kribbensis TaxID=688913 RepID=A0ABW3JXF4_9BACT